MKYSRGKRRLVGALFALLVLCLVPTERAAAEDLHFVADLSDYEAYMDPVDRDAYLILVNRTHPLPPDLIPSDLTEIANTRADGRPPQKLRTCAAKALDALFREAEALGYLDRISEDGKAFSVTSGYRSYAYQRTLFETYQNQRISQGMTEREAFERTSRTTALPGESEHQSGLCVDMHDRVCATTRFESAEVYRWLSENAWKFGFILRYPKGKEEVTGYSFEPWHYRFVGRYHAERIYRRNLTLEEYLEKGCP